MAEFTIVIGTRVWSSWSLRAWIALKKTGARFDEVLVPLRREDTKARLQAASPHGLAPAITHHRPDGDIAVWESLAICEYLAECFPEKGLLPDAPASRALARSISAEMHAGFVPLRKFMPMDLFAHHPTVGHGEEGVAENIARILEIWRMCRERHGAAGGGPFLFGRYTIADAMFAPVVTRFRTYGVALDPVSMAYCEAVLADPDFHAWEAAAEADEAAGEA